MVKDSMFFLFEGFPKVPRNVMGLSNILREMFTLFSGLTCLVSALCSYDETGPWQRKGREGPRR